MVESTDLSKGGSRLTAEPVCYRHIKLTCDIEMTEAMLLETIRWANARRYTLSDFITKALYREIMELESLEKARKIHAE